MPRPCIEYRSGYKYQLATIGQWLLAVLVPEESGVLESSTDDPLVAALDIAPWVTIGVGHGDERRQQLAVVVL